MRKIIYGVLPLLSFVSFSTNLTDSEIKRTSTKHLINITDFVVRDSINNQRRLRDTAVYINPVLNVRDNKEDVNNTSLLASTTFGFDYNRNRKYSYGVNALYSYNSIDYIKKDDKGNNNIIFLTNYATLKKEYTEYNFLYSIGYINEKIGDKQYNAMANAFNVKMNFKQLFISPYIGYSLDFITKFGDMIRTYTKSKVYFGSTTDLNLGKFQIVLFAEIGVNTSSLKLDRIFEYESGASMTYRINNEMKILVEYIGKNSIDHTLKFGYSYLI